MHPCNWANPSPSLPMKTSSEFLTPPSPRTDMIAPCLYEIHHDPRNFAEPHKFDPSRFLDPSGQRFVLHPALVPYGFGKRECLGKTLAKEWTLESSLSDYLDKLGKT